MTASVVLPPPPADRAPAELTVVPKSEQTPAAPVVRPAPSALVPRHRRRRWLAAALLAAAAGAIAAEAWRASRVPAAVHYVTVPVTRGTVTRAVTESGSVNPVTTIQVGTYVSGVIQALYCDYNTRRPQGTDLRKDRSAPLSDNRRSGTRQPLHGPGAAGEGPDQPRLRRADLPAHGRPSREGHRVAGRSGRGEERLRPGLSAGRARQVRDRAAPGGA